MKKCTCKKSDEELLELHCDGKFGACKNMSTTMLHMASRSIVMLLMMIVLFNNTFHGRVGKGFTF
jgi:hypothetical protein